MWTIINTQRLLNALIVNSITLVYYECFKAIFVCVYKFPTCFLWDVGPLFIGKSFKLGQIGRFPCHHSPLQFSPEVLDGIQVRALAGPFQDINIIFPEPFLHYLHSMFWVIVLLELPVVG